MHDAEFWDAVSAVEDARGPMERRRALEGLLRQEHVELLSMVRRYLLNEADSRTVEVLGRSVVRRWRDSFFSGLQMESLGELERINLSILAGFLSDGGQRLATFLDDPVVRVRCQAATRLGKVAERSSETLLKLAETATSDRESDVRWAAAEALAAQPGPEALSILEKLSEETEEFDAILETLRSQIISDFEVVETEPEPEPESETPSEESDGASPSPSPARKPRYAKRVPLEFFREAVSDYARLAWFTISGRKKPEDSISVRKVAVFFGTLGILLFMMVRLVVVVYGLQPKIRNESLQCPRCGLSSGIRFPRPNESCAGCGKYFYADVVVEDPEILERPIW